MGAQSDIIMKFKHIGIVGAGNMGSMMGFAFSELGLDVSIWDAKSANVDNFMKQADQVGGLTGKITGFHDISKFTASLGQNGGRKVILFSITHGTPADEVLKKIEPKLCEGDIILDGGNEHYRNTERRQRACQDIGVDWIGMGVSGGYQSARHGPSMSPGGNATALKEVMPLLELYAAKDPKSGVPCVSNIGPGGSGHFVKTVHNGIEVGMLSALCEAWGFLHSGMGLDYDHIGEIFAAWNDDGELHTNYLIKIASDICQTKKTANGKTGGHQGGYVLDNVLDKVVQDDYGTEGTPSWSIMESAMRHVSCPTLAAGFYFRVASGNREERLKVADKFSIPEPKPVQDIKDKGQMIEDVRRAVYCAFLASYCQGMELIARASNDEGWNINLSECIRIWRAGCIIQSESIADLLEPLLKEKKSLTNVKLDSSVGRELQRSYSGLKEIVSRGIIANHYLPALTAMLEYVKYTTGKMLPTKFMEAQMDYFGAHSYNKPGVPGEDPGPVAKGPHHFEWRPA
ncbi:6-phosphogluconate dehydrogenase [Trichoderma evansii]